MNIYDFSVEKVSGEMVSLKEYEGKVKTSFYHQIPLHR